MSDQNQTELKAPEPAPDPYSWVKQTLVLAFISALSYLYVYLYEAGFCDHYGIPKELIKIDTVRILFVGVTLVGVSYSLVICPN